MLKTLALLGLIVVGLGGCSDVGRYELSQSNRDLSLLLLDTTTGDVWSLDGPTQTWVKAPSR